MENGRKENSDMKNRKYTLLLLLLLWSSTLGVWAQNEVGTIELYTDKNCYIVGERLHVSVAVNPSGKQESVPDRIAYVEMADTAGTVAQTMLWIENGRGWAELDVPSDIHSGNYLLSAYTRASLLAEDRQAQGFTPENGAQKIVSIVNPQHIGRTDNILFLHPEDDMKSPVDRTYKVGQEMVVTLPKDSVRQIRVASLVRNNLLTADYTSFHPSVQCDTKVAITEMEGHIVESRPAKNASQAEESRMVMVGKGSYVYDGKKQENGNWLYFTGFFHNPQPALLNGYDGEGNPAPLEFASPYVGLHPTSLPNLQVWCTKEELQTRTKGAQQEKALSNWLKTDTLSSLSSDRPSHGLACKPEYAYDLDEYRKFSTVKEVLVEFVKGVKKKKVHGVNRLFTRFENENGYTDWPALVLLDGMPVHDIDDILEYDARLLKYIEIYNQVFTFGSSVCQGVISFVSHQGRLSNYKLDEGSRLVMYDFPQDHPQCFIPKSSELSTIYWNPSVDSTRVTLIAPSIPGNYQILIQGIDRKGCYFQSSSQIRITE